MSQRVRVIDLADYILHRCGAMSAMKLQKLVYYSQVWALVWTERELFSDNIEAWANGPVVRALYNQHRGCFRVTKGFFKGDIGRLSEDQRDVVDRVIKFYGSKDPQWLSNLTHLESPWKEAREGIPPGVSGHKVISKESIINYYTSL